MVWVLEMGDIPAIAMLVDPGVLSRHILGWIPIEAADLWRAFCHQSPKTYPYNIKSMDDFSHLHLIKGQGDLHPSFQGVFLAFFFCEAPLVAGKE